jgi:AcrR family transcriptional regulator
MPRPARHQTDTVLDAARDLVLERGPRAAGIRDIARRSGAPSGSLYHRFGSRDELIARAWLRAVRRFQAGFLDALTDDDPWTAVRAGVRWSVAFALSQPHDAALLLAHSRAALLDSAPGPAVSAELAAVNEPLEEAVRALAWNLYGVDTPEALERISYAVIDLPYAVVRRHLLAGTLTEHTTATLEAAVAALVNDTQGAPG